MTDTDGYAGHPAGVFGLGIFRCGTCDGLGLRLEAAGLESWYVSCINGHRIYPDYFTSSITILQDGPDRANQYEPTG